MDPPRRYARPPNQHVLDCAGAVLRLRSWVELGASVQVAADLCDVSESQINQWQEIAQCYPQGSVAVMMRDLEQVASQYPGGNGHSTTGNIVGRNGQPASQFLAR